MESTLAWEEPVGKSRGDDEEVEGSTQKLVDERRQSILDEP